MQIKFLNGDGEMSELTRTKDWSKTSIELNRKPQLAKFKHLT